MTYGLVLGGGGARGLAHIGVWAELHRSGLVPDVVAGTSMGGLVGAFIAAGHGAEAVTEAARGVSWRKLLDLRPGYGLLRPVAFEAWMSRYLPPTFEELERPFIVTATDVLTGRAAYLSQGDLYAALRATTAYPGALDPVPYRKMLLADGGILNQVPVDAALFLGARRVLAVDVTVPQALDLPALGRLPWRKEPHLGTVQALRRAVEIMQAQLTDARLSLYRPDALLSPDLGSIDLQDFRRSAEAIAAGRREAREHLPRLRELFG